MTLKADHIPFVRPPFPFLAGDPISKAAFIILGERESNGFTLLMGCCIAPGEATGWHLAEHCASLNMKNLVVLDKVVLSVGTVLV